MDPTGPVGIAATRGSCTRGDHARQSAARAGRVAAVNGSKLRFLLAPARELMRACQGTGHEYANFGYTGGTSRKPARQTAERAADHDDRRWSCADGWE